MMAVPSEHTRTSASSDATQPRATRSHAHAADRHDGRHHRLRRGLFTARDRVRNRADRSAGPPWCRPRDRDRTTVRSPTFVDAASPRLCGPSSEEDILGAARLIGCAGRSSPIAQRRRQLARLPVRRRAGRPRGLRRLAAHDRRYDEPTAEGLRRRRTSWRFPGRVCPAVAPFGASRSRISRHSPRPRRKAGVRLAVESAYRSEARQQTDVRGLGHAPQEKPRPDVSVRAPDTRSTSSGPPSISRPRAAGPRGRQAFARSRHARWLAANAWRFGWIQSYPPGAETQTCYGAEAWHYRYVGRDVAAEVHASGMTLRAWLWLHASAD